MRFCIQLFVAVLFSTVASAQTSSIPTQFQSWNEIQLILPLITKKDAKNKSFDKLTLIFSGVFRLGRENVETLDNRAGATLDYRLNRYVSLSTGVLYRTDEIVKNTRRYESRFNVAATFSKSWRGFSFRNRNLYEHRFRNGRIDLNLYRARIQTSYPVKFKEKELFSPFISNEGYYDLRAKTWIQNEFYAGISRRLNDRTSIDIAYLRSDTRPFNVNGISMSLKIRLR